MFRKVIAINYPKISIITVVRNGKDFIEDAICSVRKQTYPNIEHIVIDGASTDGTQEIIASYQDKIAAFISEPDKGLYDAMNKGIRLATGEYVGTLNSDDKLASPYSIALIAKAFQNNNQLDCVHGDLIYIDRSTGNTVQLVNSKEYRSGLFERNWHPLHPTFYCKTSLFSEHGFFRDDYKISADRDLMQRFIQTYNASSKYIKTTLVLMRTGGISDSGLSKNRFISKWEKIRSFYNNGGVLSLAKYLLYTDVILLPYRVLRKLFRLTKSLLFENIADSRSKADKANI